MVTRQDVGRMQACITDEIFSALGISSQSGLRRFFGWLFFLPTRKFSRLFARTDQAVAQAGLPGGCRSLVGDFTLDLRVCGEDHLKGEGPLLVVANHPGAYDSACLGSVIERCDLKLIVSETGFYHALPAIDPWLIHTTKESTRRMLALRQALSHLQNGGSLLTFGTGKIEPDPALGNGDEIGIRDWSPAIEILLRKAPETRLVLAIVSQVLLPRFARSAIADLRKDIIGRRRLAEFTQVIWHLLFPHSLCVRPRISFSESLRLETLMQEAKNDRILPAILLRAEALQQAHLSRPDEDFHTPAFLR